VVAFPAYRMGCRKRLFSLALEKPYSGLRLRFWLQSWNTDNTNYTDFNGFYFYSEKDPFDEMKNIPLSVSISQTRVIRVLFF
jgi:hypothetical protein